MEEYLRGGIRNSSFIYDGKSEIKGRKKSPFFSPLICRDRRPRLSVKSRNISIKRATTRTVRSCTEQSGVVVCPRAFDERPYGVSICFIVGTGGLLRFGHARVLTPPRGVRTRAPLRYLDCPFQDYSSTANAVPLPSQGKAFCKLSRVRCGFICALDMVFRTVEDAGPYTFK